MRIKDRISFLETIAGMIAVYQTRGFIVKTIEADGAFKGIAEELKEEPYKVDLHLYNLDGHVEMIEKTNSIHERKNLDSLVTYTI